VHRNFWLERLLSVLCLLLAPTAGAHSGHGVQQTGLAHLLSDPTHAGPLVLLLAVAAASVLLLAKFRITSRERSGEME